MQQYGVYIPGDHSFEIHNVLPTCFHKHKYFIAECAIAVKCDLCHQVTTSEFNCNFLDLSEGQSTIAKAVNDAFSDEIIMDYKCTL